MTIQEMVEQVNSEYGGVRGYTIEITGREQIAHANLITYSVKRAPLAGGGRTVITHHVMVSGNNGRGYDGIVSRYEQ